MGINMNKMKVDDLKVRSKRVLVRVDFNVPINELGEITDDTRIRASLPTIRYLVDHGARVILASHSGRPKGKINPKYSLAPMAARLEKLLQCPVKMANNCLGDEVRQQALALQDGEILVLENLRFHPEEEANDPDFAKSLAGLAELFVNDAFGTAHRAHASTAGIAAYLPAAAGFLMSKEVEIMGQALANPQHPFVAVIGGAKVSDKIEVIRNLLNKIDALIIGGGMANTFLKAEGYEIGQSLCEPEKTDLAAELIKQAKAQKVQLLLPEDVVVAKEFSNEAPFRIVPVSGLDLDDQILDIGPKSVDRFAGLVKGARTVVWNGPMGVFEMTNFAYGTEGMARALAACPGITIVGGGDSVAAVEKIGVTDQLTHISTGGGASLEFLEGKTLPGVAVLQEKP